MNLYPPLADTFDSLSQTGTTVGHPVLDLLLNILLHTSSILSRQYVTFEEDNKHIEHTGSFSTAPQDHSEADSSKSVEQETAWYH
jgi:hypothetical protein